MTSDITPSLYGDVQVGSHRILQRGIIALSVSSNWAEARLEWELTSIRFAAEFEECLCTHYPILEICLLTNRLNGNRVEVGNVCVKRFMGIDSGKVFEGIRRIRKDITKGLNPAASALAYDKGVITCWERDFSLDTWRKRDLSAGQRAKREQINRKVLRYARREHF